MRQVGAIADERERAATAGGKPGPARSSAFTSVSRRFTDDINALVGALNQTTAHFVRCMKPNHRSYIAIILHYHPLRCAA